MSLAALARQLADAGTPIEGIILALEAVEARERATAVKREQAAARKRAQRERERDQGVTVTRQSRDGHETPPAPNKSPPDPQKLTPTPEHTHTGARGASGWKVPEGVNGQHWTDFLANRRTKRLGFTPTAYRGQLKALSELSDDEWPPGRIVQFAAERGWGAFFDPRGRDDGRRNGNHARSATGQGRTIDAIVGFVEGAQH